MPYIYIVYKIHTAYPHNIYIYTVSLILPQTYKDNICLPSLYQYTVYLDDICLHTTLKHAAYLHNKYIHITNYIEY